MDIIKIIGIGFISLIITIILKEYRKEYAIYVVIICGAIILLYSIDTISSIVNFLKELSRNKSYNTDFISCLLKITGISILTEYAVSICKDSGESAIASKIDLGGKVLIISMSIPVIGTTLESLIKILNARIKGDAMNEIIESQTNLLGINDFINKATQYTNQNFPELNISKIFNESITGNMGSILDKIDILNFFSNELSYAIQIMIDVIIIIIINSIFKAIIENLGNSNSAQITYFLQYMVIVSLVINTFISILNYTKESINSVVNFMNLLIPLLTTLMLSTGTLVTTTVVEPILLIMVSVVGNFINLFLIPMLMVSITISIVSNISDKVQIERLSKFLKSSIVWLLGILLTIFTTTLSLQGTLTSSVDGITAKTAKAAVSTFIPVVGKIMGDTVDSVIGCGNILKNSIGIIGVIVIIGIVAVPIIKILVLWISFKLTSAVCEVVADVKIVKLIDQISDGYKILLGILISVSVMFIIGITLVIKMTNTALMYR